MKYYLRNYSWLVLESSNPDEIIQDFRNDEELMYLMKTHKKMKTHNKMKINYYIFYQIKLSQL